MTFRLFALVAVTTSIVGCASQGTAVRPPANSLLIGADNSNARVLIKSVDNGPTLWSAPGALGSKVTITPGVHKVEVVCEASGSGHFAPGNVTIDVQPGHTYDLAGSVAPGANECNVTATSRS
jgi:hypothetical protein